MTQAYQHNKFEDDMSKIATDRAPTDKQTDKQTNESAQRATLAKTKAMQVHKRPIKANKSHLRPYKAIYGN